MIKEISSIYWEEISSTKSGAVESFNITIQKFLNEAYKNSMFNGDEEWPLPLMVSDFLHDYNSKRVHSITKMIPREILFNFKTKALLSKLLWIQKINFEVGDSVLLT